MKLVTNGGQDSGAVANGLKEKHINLTVALRLKEKLIRNGFEVKLSRETDVFVDLNTIAKMANEWGADIVIAVHHNAGAGDGYEIIHSIYYGKGYNLAQHISREFAGLGQNSHGTALKTKKNNSGTDYFSTIRQTNAPAVITEYAFIDSDDVQAVDTDAELDGEARAIAKAVCSYFGRAYDHDAEPERDEVTDLVHLLAGKISLDEKYWATNCRDGKQVEGKYVATILRRMQQAGMM